MLYVLLKKPGQEHPNVVSEHREIALMAQEMKMVLQAVRWSCYARASRRLLNEQVGWVAGLGCTDAGLTPALVIQQSRELQHELYLLFIDIATMFPVCDRDILKAGDLWAGLLRAPG